MTSHVWGEFHMSGAWLFLKAPHNQAPKNDSLSPNGISKGVFPPPHPLGDSEPQLNR